MSFAYDRPIALVAESVLRGFRRAQIEKNPRTNGKSKKKSYVLGITPVGV